MKTFKRLLVASIFSTMLLGMSMIASAATVPTATVLRTGSENLNTLPKYTYTVPANTTGTITSVNITAPGEVYFNCQSAMETDVKVQLFSDAAATKPVGYSWDYEDLKPNDKQTFSWQVTKAGTYYVKMVHYGWELPTTPGTLTYQVYQAS